MDEGSSLAGRFEENRRHLRSVAYRMLGSLSEADDAVQEAWLRLSRTDASGIENLTGWLTSVVARVCLDMLRARRSRAEDPGDDRAPELLSMDDDDTGPEREPPISRSVAIDGRGSGDPESEVIMADSISLALLVVLETLAPSERLAFVLHDLFDVPFIDIAPIVGKTPAAARQMASRARRRVRGSSSPPEADLGAQQEVAAAFLAAARSGDFDALLRLLDPDVVVKNDLGRSATVVRGARSAAEGAITGARLTSAAQLVQVDGAPGHLAFDANGEPRALVAFTIRRGKITEISLLTDPQRLRQLSFAND